MKWFSNFCAKVGLLFDLCSSNWQIAGGLGWKYNCKSDRQCVCFAGLRPVMAGGATPCRWWQTGRPSIKRRPIFHGRWQLSFFKMQGRPEAAPQYKHLKPYSIVTRKVTSTSVSPVLQGSGLVFSGKCFKVI